MSENLFYRFSAGFRCRRCGASATEGHLNKHEQKVVLIEGRTIEFLRTAGIAVLVEAKKSGECRK